jgi:DNA polymerase-3 subunit beta
MVAIQSIAASHEKDGSGIDFTSTKSEIVAKFKGERVFARLVEGRFPRWRDVFPDRDAHKFIVIGETLASATRAAAIVTTEQSKGVLYSFGTEVLTLTARSSEHGESSVEFDMVESRGISSVKLDPHFVSDVLRAFATLDGEPTVTIEAAGPGDAVVFLYGEDAEYRSVIMPLATE